MPVSAYRIQYKLKPPRTIWRAGVTRYAARSFIRQEMIVCKTSRARRRIDVRLAIQIIAQCDCPGSADLDQNAQHAYAPDPARTGTIFSRRV